MALTEAIRYIHFNNFNNEQWRKVMSENVENKPKEFWELRREMAYEHAEDDLYEVICGGDKENIIDLLVEDELANYIPETLDEMIGYWNERYYDPDDILFKLEGCLDENDKSVNLKERIQKYFKEFDGDYADFEETWNEWEKTNE